MNDIVEKLKEFGFNSYEAKTYLALLKKYPSTGYEISQMADIPQSRAYDALKSLESESIVFSTKEKPQRYTPISPKELTQRFKRKINSTIDYLEKKLPNVKESYNEPINYIYEYENIINKIKEIITNTKKTLFLEIWNNEYRQIEQELSDAYDRGINIKIVAYDNFSSIYGLVYNHDGAKELEQTFGSRLIFLLSDNEESLFGKVQKQVIWTKNIDIAFLIKEFTVHDMYLLDVYANFPEQLKYFYGPGFRKLKEKILDKRTDFNIH